MDGNIDLHIIETVSGPSHKDSLRSIQSECGTCECAKWPAGPLQISSHYEAEPNSVTKIPRGY